MVKYRWKIASSIFKVGSVCLVLGLLLSAVSDVAGKKPGSYNTPDETPAVVTFLPISNHVVEIDSGGAYLGSMNSEGDFRLQGLFETKRNRGGRKLWINAPLASSTCQTCPPDVKGLENTRFEVNVNEGNPEKYGTAHFSVVNEWDGFYTTLRFNGDEVEGNSLVTVTSGCGYTLTKDVPPLLGSIVSCDGDQPSVWHVTSLPDGKSLAGINRLSRKAPEVQGQYTLEFEALIVLEELP